MFGSRRKVSPAGGDQQQQHQQQFGTGRAGYEAIVGGPLVRPAEVVQVPIAPRGTGYGPLLLAGGAGTPCSASFQPSAAAQKIAAATALASNAPPVPPSNNSKAAEAERKRAVESAAAKRCASGRVFPGTTYRLDQTIGKGSYGRVKLATDLRTGHQFAIKFLAKDLMTKQAHWVRVRREINLLTLTHHPHIIKVNEWLEAGEDILIIMDYVAGKDLFDRINEKPEKRYGEEEARAIFRQMVSALDYCHQNRIVHRDLKPENVMIDSNGQVKLIDFGFANLFHPRDHLNTNCGSPLYAAPEIVQAKPYIGPEVDIWSLGIVLYAMLVGALPFEDENLKGLYKKIGEGRFTFPEHVSLRARDLIASMLQVNVLNRATMAHVKMHPWVNQEHINIPESYVPPRPTQIVNPRPDLVQLLPEYGYAQSHEGLRQTIMFQPDSPAFAGYCLLEEKEEREYEQCLRSQAIPIRTRPEGMLSSSLKEYRNMTPVIMMEPEYPPAQAVYHTPRYSVALDTSLPMSSLPTTPLKQNPAARSNRIPSVSGTASNAHSNIMAQAAATVVNKFKRFRDLRFGLGQTQQSSGESGPTRTSSRPKPV